MWQYLTEPRSKDYYDDSDTGGSEPSCDWNIILWFPVIMLFVFVISIHPFLALAGYFFHDVYTTLNRTIKSGEFSYPFLVKSGAVLTGILAIAYLAEPRGAPIHLSVSLVLVIGFVFIFTILPIFALCLHRILRFHSFLETKIGALRSYGLYVVFVLILLLTITIVGVIAQPPKTPLLPMNTPSPTETFASLELAPSSTPTSVHIPVRSVEILVDDFSPQPYQGDAVYFYNRLAGDRGTLNKSLVNWGDGQVTTTISTGNTWGGLWMSLNHPIREDLAVNFSAVLPQPILPAYQSQITGITVEISGGTPNKTLRIELKDGDTLSWNSEIILSGGKQSVQADLPPLQNISQLVLVLDQAYPGDSVMIDKISLNASTPVMDTATAAFVWSYGMLLNNWNPSTGLVRDRAGTVSGEFDAIQATGSLAAATALAEQVGVVDHADAVAIVAKISDTLLTKVPRNHGLWPHWVKITPNGKIKIVPNTEWSSVDTVIAAIGLLDAQQSLGLGTAVTEQMLREIEWNNLVTEKGISHGYTYDDKLIPYGWDVFGGESWLVELAYASASGKIAPLAYPSAPTANGSGFIDELAWLYILPPTEPDHWETDWAAYRADSVEKQVLYYATNDPSSCFAQTGLFGLSAAEVPVPARVPKKNIYQAFGAGGQFAAPNDGSPFLGAPVVAPHYSAMVASLWPERSIGMWNWLIEEGLFSPLTNVESLSFTVDSDCTSDILEWNQLKGSWNLALQALGWGRYLAERDGQIPVLWQATKANPFLQRGYLMLAPNKPQAVTPYLKQNETLSTILENLDIHCEGEFVYTRSLPGIYRYRITDAYGGIDYYSVEKISKHQDGKALSVLPWPPLDTSIPPVSVSTSKTGEEIITTTLGTFQSTRMETTQEYRIFTSNLSFPSGTVKTSEWYVCGVGLIHATINHSGTYQTRAFERQSELELISFTPLP